MTPERKNYYRAWQIKNRIKVNAIIAKYRDANRDICNARIKLWKMKNKDKCAGYERQRVARKINACPKWANSFFIQEAYHLAKLRTKLLGTKWSVDHIVPLKSTLVCGLHVHNNLRVIPHVENLKKSNRHWPDMPGA